MIKNLRIRTKLYLGFGAILAVLLVVAVYSYSSLNIMEKNMDKFYKHPYTVATNVIEIKALTTAIHRSMKDVALAMTNQKRNNVAKVVEGYEKEIFDKFVILKERFLGDQKDVNDAYDAIKDWKAIRNEVIDLSNQGKMVEAAKITVGKGADQVNLIDSTLEKLEVFANDKAKSFHVNSGKEAEESILYLEILVGVGVILGLIIASMITKMISKQIKELSIASKKLSVGDVDVDVKSYSDDEIGTLAKEFNVMVEGVKEQAKCIEKIADGDMTTKVNVRSDKDIINIKIKELLGLNNQIFGDIRNAAEQVSSASLQVAAGSQILSQGATEQSSSIEEVTATISDVASQADENASNSRKANELALDARNKADEGSTKMKEMMISMEEINDASGNISRIIKVIDEIAFQTNILALNAAVEAARAGVHGKGFAVVAEEVRNLAARSAQAAKETTELIESSVAKTQSGTAIAKETAASLTKIMELAQQVESTISIIAQSSSEQASSVIEISQAIDQVSGATQTNASTAQESAASSQELSGQAAVLKDAIGRFKIIEDGSASIANNMSFAPSEFNVIETQNDTLEENDSYSNEHQYDQFGKY